MVHRLSSQIDSSSDTLFSFAGAFEFTSGMEAIRTSRGLVPVIESNAPTHLAERDDYFPIKSKAAESATIVSYKVA